MADAAKFNANREQAAGFLRGLLGKNSSPAPDAVAADPIALPGTAISAGSVPTELGAPLDHDIGAIVQPRIVVAPPQLTIEQPPDIQIPAPQIRVRVAPQIVSAGGVSGGGGVAAATDAVPAKRSWRNSIGAGDIGSLFTRGRGAPQEGAQVVSDAAAGMSRGGEGLRKALDGLKLFRR